MAGFWGDDDIKDVKADLKTLVSTTATLLERLDNVITQNADWQNKRAAECENIKHTAEKAHRRIDEVNTELVRKEGWLRGIWGTVTIIGFAVVSLAAIIIAVLKK